MMARSRSARVYEELRRQTRYSWLRRVLTCPPCSPQSQPHANRRSSQPESQNAGSGAFNQIKNRRRDTNALTVSVVINASFIIIEKNICLTR
jgi:hypothetical protein